jgi:hypothetical protein
MDGAPYAPPAPAGPNRKRAVSAAWWLPLLLLAIGCGAITVVGALQLVYFEPTSDALYTAWVAKPIVSGFGLAAVALLIAVVLVAFAARGTVSRSVIAGVALVAAVASSADATVTWHHRRTIGPRLLRAVAALDVPADAIDVQPAKLEHGDGFDGVSRAEPVANRSWRYADDSRDGTCAALTRDYSTQLDWTASASGCLFFRSQGDIRLTVSISYDTSSTKVTVELTASPADNS